MKRTIIWIVFLFSVLSVGSGLAAVRQRAFLGVFVDDVPRRIAHKYHLERGEGVLITMVEDDSPADYADLERGDIILAVDGKPVRSPSQLRRIIGKHKPGDRITLEVIHDGRRKKLEVRLGKLSRKRRESEIIILREPRWRRGWFFLRPETPCLGVQMQELNEDLARYFKVEPYAGVLIAEVEEDSPAEEAGLKAGDILTAIDGEDVEAPEDVFDLLSEYEPGDEVELSVLRFGKRLTFKVELGEREDASRFERLPFRFPRFRFDFYSPNDLIYDLKYENRPDQSRSFGFREWFHHGIERLRWHWQRVVQNAESALRYWQVQLRKFSRGFLNIAEQVREFAFPQVTGSLAAYAPGQRAHRDAEHRHRCAGGRFAYPLAERPARMPFWWADYRCSQCHQ